MELGWFMTETVSARTILIADDLVIHYSRGFLPIDPPQVPRPLQELSRPHKTSYVLTKS